MPQLKVQEWLELTFKNTWELNKVIKDHLPGWSPFQYHKLMMDEEVCDVYFQDILACIHGLFGDLDFTPYLIFAPEKHYADKEKQECMYHDMHTRKWWWSTQVSYRMYTPYKVDPGWCKYTRLQSVIEQPLVLSHLILSTMLPPSYQMNYPTLQFDCYRTALYLIFYILSLISKLAAMLLHSVRATPKSASSMAHLTVTRALALWAHT